jgi:hypothetical protein
MLGRRRGEDSEVPIGLRVGAEMGAIKSVGTKVVRKSIIIIVILGRDLEGGVGVDGDDGRMVDEGLAGVVGGGGRVAGHELEVGGGEGVGFAERAVLEGLEEGPRAGAGGVGLGVQYGLAVVVVVVFRVHLVRILGHHGAVERGRLTGLATGPPARREPVAEQEETQAPEAKDDPPAHRRSPVP